MKKTLFLIVVAALCCISCAKTEQEKKNKAEQSYFEAWIRVNYPDAKKTFPGLYIIDDQPGSGELVGDPKDSTFLEADFTISTLDGQYVTYTYEELAKQLGVYDKKAHYGPKLMGFGEGATYAGAEYTFNTMRVGGRRKAVIPGWLITMNRYDSEQGYIDNITGTNYIYDVTILSKVENETKWEVDSIGRYLQRNFGRSVSDSLKYGFYYIQTKAPRDTARYKNDSTFYINYIGRRLDGQVFDTTIKDTARMYGIFSPDKKYEPVSIKYNDVYSSITLSGSSVIDGFAYALYQMRPYESCTAVFISALGYSSSSQTYIPEYSPLRFDISIVDKE